MPKKTLQEKLALRVERLPSKVVYTILYGVVCVMKKILKTSFVFKAHPNKDKGPYILVSNHASRNDYVFTAPAVWPHRLNYVVGYNEFFRFPQNLLLKLGQVIPKRNFVPDIHTITSIMRIIKQGGHVMMMPEGMSSITGMCQPVMPGTGKLIKKLGVNVYYTKIAGGYLTYTKHCLDQRVGKTEVVVDQMFTAEELKTLSETQIEERMNKLLAHDDYLWNKDKGIVFGKKGQMAKQLDTLLYRCPKCGAVYSMKCEGDTMTCLKCSNTIEIAPDYSIKAVGEGSICPEVVTDWTIMEREEAAKMVRKEGFSFSDNVKIGMLPKYKYLSGDNTSEICGEAKMTLDSEGLHIDGVINGVETQFNIEPQNIPTFGMCTDISRIYTFINGEFYEFYPERGEVLLWDHLVEELHRYKGGKWQNVEYRHS